MLCTCRSDNRYAIDWSTDCKYRSLCVRFSSSASTNWRNWRSLYWRKSLARGYANRPDLTKEKFIPHPFKSGERLYYTGDKASYLSDGNLQFHGRIDDQVKIRGFRIELGEIEAVLQAHSSVKEAVVLVREDNQGDKRLVAYVVGEGSVHEWREHLQTHLPNYMVPTNFIEMEFLPLTPNGKLDLKALPILSEQSAENTVYPRTPLEELIASVWSQVLGIGDIGVQDSFFELGGHSLLATQVVSRLQEVFQIKLPVRELFEYSTIEALAKRMDQLRKGNENEKFHHWCRWNVEIIFHYLMPNSAYGLLINLHLIVPFIICQWHAALQELVT